MIAAIKLVWGHWKTLARKIADVQARIVLTLFYFVVVGPFALGVRVCSDPWRRRPAPTPRWVDRPAPDAETASLARRQF